MQQELFEAYEAKQTDDIEIVELKKQLNACSRTRSTDRARITELEESIARLSRPDREQRARARDETREAEQKVLRL